MPDKSQMADVLLLMYPVCVCVCVLACISLNMSAYSVRVCVTAEASDGKRRTTEPSDM